MYIAIAVAIGAGVVLTVMNYLSSSNQSAPDAVVCTMDAMQCPDGSYVGRSGSNCEFVCP
jgi:hypothetical protein